MAAIQGYDVELEISLMASRCGYLIRIIQLNGALGGMAKQSAAVLCSSLPICIGIKEGFINERYIEV